MNAGLGLANIAGAAFSAYPVAGSFSRSAVANDSGAKSGAPLLSHASFVASNLTEGRQSIARAVHFGNAVIGQIMASNDTELHEQICECLSEVCVHKCLLTDWEWRHLPPGVQVSVSDLVIPSA